MAVLLLELNEMTWHFVDRLTAAGRLPHLARLMREGACVRTHIPDVAPDDPRFTRKTSPWIIWPSVYTGMRPSKHELVAFGQDTTHLAGRYLWDVLAAEGHSYGVFGSLLSYPPRRNACFYVPESLANSADCLPESLRSLQKFFVFGAHHYSESGFLAFMRAGIDFMRAWGNAISAGAAVRALWQLPLEILGRGPAKAERATLHSILTFDAFSRLYRRFRPEFATIHLNHIAFFQHRYWRATEPHAFSRSLSATDRRFYRDAAERERDESRYATKIENAYAWTDAMVGRAIDMLSQGDFLVVASALSQRRYDPVSEIHNPVVRFLHAELFFERLGMTDFVVRYEMNPDITLDCIDDDRAARYHAVIEGLHWDDGTPIFYCQKRRKQLFLELVVPPHVQHSAEATIRHRDFPEFEESAATYVWQSETNEQSTAHHDERGLFVVWKKGGAVAVERNDVLVTEIAPTILALFGIPAQEWHRDFCGSPVRTEISTCVSDVRGPNDTRASR